MIYNHNFLFRSDLNSFFVRPGDRCCGGGIQLENNSSSLIFFFSAHDSNELKEKRTKTSLEFLKRFSRTWGGLKLTPAAYVLNVLRYYHSISSKHNSNHVENRNTVKLMFAGSMCGWEGEKSKIYRIYGFSSTITLGAFNEGISSTLGILLVNGVKKKKKSLKYKIQ